MNPLLSVALVGLAVICVGLLIVVGVIVFRVAGERSIEFLMVLGRGGREEAEADKTYFASPKPDLRSIAKAQDFDAALAKHIVQDEIEPHHIPPSQSDAPFPDAQPRLGLRGKNQQTRALRHDDEDDNEDEF